MQGRDDDVVKPVQITKEKSIIEECKLNESQSPSNAGSPVKIGV